MPEPVAILGQGLAGTLLSFRLLEAGVPHVVYDPGHRHSASAAAAGLVNPVTGRRFVLVADYARHLAGFGVYERLGVRLGRPLVHPLTLLRDLDDVATRNLWDLRRQDPSYAAYLGAPARAETIGVPGLAGSAWLGPTLGALRVDLPGLVGAWRAELLAQGRLRAVAVGPEAVGFAEAHVAVAGQPYAAVVDARGAASAKTGHWAHVPWRLSKGEALRFRALAWPLALASKLGGHFLAPVGEGADVWFGGSATDRFDDELPEPAVQAGFARELAAMGLAVPPEAERLAAVRPTMRDRAVVVAAHPRHPRFILLNGLGTRGALVAPSAVERCWSMLRGLVGGD